MCNLPAQNPSLIRQSSANFFMVFLLSFRSHFRTLRNNVLLSVLSWILLSFEINDLFRKKNIRLNMWTWSRKHYNVYMYRYIQIYVYVWSESTLRTRMTFWPRLTDKQLSTKLLRFSCGLFKEDFPCTLPKIRVRFWLDKPIRNLQV